MCHLSGFSISGLAQITPSDVTPPADDYIRTGTAYTAKAQEATHQGYSFKGWFTDDACTLSYTDGTVLSTDTILYGKWEKIRNTAFFRWRRLSCDKILYFAL